MQRGHSAFPVTLILIGFSRRGEASVPVMVGLGLFSLFQVALVLGGSYMDGTWRLPNGGKGLLDHYGVWAILIADPLLIVSTAYAWYQFRNSMACLPLDPDAGASPKLRRTIRPYLEFINLRRSGLSLYALLVAIGALSWANNIYENTEPVRFFGHDVFDSTQHAFGFIATKMVLLISWVLIYPATGFVTLSLSLSTFLILRKLRRAALIKPNVYHPDGCYGFSTLGKLNICTLFPFLFAFLVVFAILVTHEKAYASVVIPLVILTITFLGVSIITIYPILTLAKNIEKGLYRKLLRQSKKLSHNDFNMSLAFGIERLCFALSTGSPYSRSAQIVLLTIRAIPVTVTAVRLFLPFV